MSKATRRMQDDLTSQPDSIEQPAPEGDQLSDEELSMVTGGAKKAAPAAVPAAPAPMM